MQHLTTRGSPFARGRQQGEACAALARPWFERTLAAVRHAVDATTLRREVAARRRRLERVYPEGQAECCGIAAGMGWAEDDYFAVAASFKLLHRLTNCTVAGFRTADGRPLFAKTDDIGRAELGMNMLETTLPDRGYRHVHFHFAGSIWTIAGMNEHGLAMGMTGIPGPMLETDGLFSLDALHTILPACATVDEALAHIRALPLNGYGFSLTLADASGRFEQIEKSGAGFVVLPLPPGGAYLHGNRILDAEFAARNPPQTAALTANSDRRMTNAARLLATLPRTEAGLRELIVDRGPDGAIRQTGADGMFTDFWVLFAAAGKRVEYGAGWPDCADTGTVRLADVFSAGETGQGG